MGGKCDVIVWVRKLSFKRRHSRTEQTKRHISAETCKYQTHPSKTFAHSTRNGSNVFEHCYIMFSIFIIRKYEPINRILPLQKLPFHFLQQCFWFFSELMNIHHSSFGFLLKVLQRSKKRANVIWYLVL